MSLPSTGSFSGSTRYDGSPGENDISYSSGKHFGKRSVSSLQSSLPTSNYANSDVDLLHKSTTASLRERYDEFAPQQGCQSSKEVKHGRKNWLSTTILILSLYSTIFSGIFVAIALHQPRYGRMIHTNGALTASSSAFLTSAIAKTIELSFVTVIVAFLGQALARRAYSKNNHPGVTLAELSMRTWIMQPGTMLTHWDSVRYAGITILGITSLIAAIIAMLYTSAATALVQPQLKFPDWSKMVMQGLVKSQFANPVYISDKCRTPISKQYDQVYAGATCLQLEHAAMGYHNYFAYLGNWAGINDYGNGSTELSARPKGFALFNDNTTVSAPWIEQVNMSALYEHYGYIINNVSMALPHTGVVSAAIDPINDIMQPEELDGLGIYDIRASVPSPVLHVLCVTSNSTILEPLVNYTNSNYGEVDSTLSKIFQWDGTSGSVGAPPAFPKLPMDYNTVLNDTTGIQYGRESVYILGKGGPADRHGNPTEDIDYSLCQLRMSLTPYCSTQYNASSSGATLEAVCEDRTDDMSYIRSLPNATSGSASVSMDWPNIGSMWARSLSLNDGVTDGNASNARLLTQLIVTDANLGSPHLDQTLPSMAEALAVMAGCTLIQSSLDAPFLEFWNYSATILDVGIYQYFNASIRAQEYASGGTASYQKGFNVVLMGVFVLNLLVLAYFLVHRDWYTDFSEPSNLFSLAVNSPPSEKLAGSCGGGPQGDQYRVPWKLNDDGGHVYMESQETDASPGLRRRRFSERFEMSDSPISKAFSRFSVRRST